MKVCVCVGGGGGGGEGHDLRAVHHKSAPNSKIRP